jgi:hypothetical protein
LLVQFSEHWTSKHNFLDFFERIYTYVKSLQSKPVSDLPGDYDETIEVYSIRETNKGPGKTPGNPGKERRVFKISKFYLLISMLV